MTLRIKTFLIVGGIFALFVIILSLTAQFILLNAIGEIPVSEAPPPIQLAEILTDAYRLSQVNLRVFISILLVMSVVSVAALVYLLDKFVLNRLSVLRDEVSAIGVTGDFSKRLSITAEDELARLAGDINLTLEAMQHLQRDLQESEIRYRSLVENAPDVIFTTLHGADGFGQLASLNPAFEKLTQWQTKDWLGKRFDSLIHPEDLHVATDMNVKIFRGESPSPFELRIRTKNGDFIVGEFVAAPHIVQGKIVGALGILRDITGRKQVEDALSQRAAELAVLHAVATAGAEATNEDALLERTTQIIGESLYPDEFGVILFDPARKVLQPHASYRGHTANPSSLNIPLGKGIVGRVVETGKPVRVSDVLKDPDYFTRASVVMRSELCVPLKAGDRLIGVINAESERLDVFTEADEHLLVTLSGQLATAIERLRAENAERQRAWQLEILYEVSQEIISAILDREQVYEAVHRAVSKMMPAEVFVITLAEPSTNQVKLAYMIDRGERCFLPPTPLDSSLAAHVINRGRGLLIEDFDDNKSHFQDVHTGGQESVCSILAVPLQLSGKAIGILSVQSYRPYVFTKNDLYLLELLAAYAAIALDNTRLFTETRRQALTFENMFDAVILTDMSGVIIDWNDAAVRLFGYRKEEVLGKSPTIIHRPEDIPDLQDRIMKCVKNDGRWAGEVSFVRKDGSRGVSEVVIVPLRDESGVIIATVGVNRDITVRKRREMELEVVAKASRALRTAITLQEMLPVVLNQLIELLKVRNACLALRDLNSGEIIFELGYGEWEPAAGRRLPADQGVTGHVIATGQTYVSSNAASDPNFIEDGLPIGEYRVAVSPLVAQAQSIGAVLLARETTFTPAEIRLLTAVTDIAASALHRACLHEQTRRYADQMATVSAIGRTLAETHDLDDIYNRLVESISYLLPDIGVVHVFLFDAENGTLRHVYSKRFAKIPADDQNQLEIFDSTCASLRNEVLHSHHPHIVNDLKHYFKGLPPDNPISISNWRSSLCAPLMAKSEISGVLHMMSSTPNRFSKMDAELIALVGNTAAITIDNARLFIATEQRLRRLAALRVMDIAISSSFDLRVTLNVVLDQVTAQLGVDAASVLLYHDHSRMLEYVAGRGFRSSNITTSCLRLGEELSGEAALSHRLVSSAGRAKSVLQTERLSGEDFVDYFGVPLVAKGQVKGVLEIFHRAPLLPDPEWIDFLETLANDTAIAIDSAFMFNELQRSNIELLLAYDTTLEGWSRALELRDRETEGHTKRVAEMAFNLGQAMGVEESDLVHLRHGALLHDIGKMGVPDSILLKPGPLSEEEWEIMRLHPSYAYQMLSPISYLHPAIDIPYCHHEKWDGTGYPRGLEGQHIPLAARIFAVVDVWDALRSERPYRPAWSDQQAREYILEQSGHHFDPDVVVAFFRMLDKEEDELEAAGQAVSN